MRILLYDRRINLILVRHEEVYKWPPQLIPQFDSYDEELTEDSGADLENKVNIANITNAKLTLNIASITPCMDLCRQFLNTFSVVNISITLL